MTGTLLFNPIALREGGHDIHDFLAQMREIMPGDDFSAHRNAPRWSEFFDNEGV